MGHSERTLAFGTRVRKHSPGMGHIKLHIPGPVEVSAKTYQAFCAPMIGHRGQGYKDLVAKIQPQLQELLATKQLVYLSTSSAWGVMEGAIRNLVQKKVLNCMCGAFSDKWLDVAKRCGKPAEGLQVDWGSPIRPEQIDAKLATGQFDALTLIHNETSTGTMSDLPALMAVLREFPDVISIVDTVSSFTVLPIKKDELGIDILLTGSQKALAMPPGLSLFSVSQRARDRAAKATDRGYYFDLIEFQKNHENGMTPSTPVIPLIYALKSKLEDIRAEGVEVRYARHARLNATVRNWGLAQGFKLFPQEGYGSLALNCFANTLNVDLSALNKILKSKHHLVIDGGYGKLKGKTFRISNMGDETDATIAELIRALDLALAETPKLVN